MFKFFRKPAPVLPQPARRPLGFLSTHAMDSEGAPRMAVDEYLRHLHKALPAVSGQTAMDAAQSAMDDSSSGVPLFKELSVGQNTASDALIGWYTTQGFIGHQLAGILAQHWLINKVCSMPGDDAIRKGYRIVSADGQDLPDTQLQLLRQYDKRYRLKHHMREFVRKGRIFGIRLALFKVESEDLDYYEKPFNIDGVKQGAYKGIVQIDPYWVAPMLDEAAASRPDSPHFYTPTWWMINGKRVHRSHLVIYKHSEPVDVLKPQYLYGGIPLPQQIMERVYAAERTANEAPQLAQTKRTNVWMTDMERVMADPGKAVSRLNDWAYYRDNFGVKLGDKEGDEFQQFDTGLADFDALIMTQYQLVASQAGVPSTKLLGTTPKGFNATGEYEEASYHEMLESIQEHDLSPLLERHHALVLKSFGQAGELQTMVAWEPLDSPTAKELADTQLVKAQTGQALIASGAIDSETERQRLAADPTSGYAGLDLNSAAAPGIPEGPDDEDEQDGAA